MNKATAVLSASARRCLFIGGRYKPAPRVAVAMTVAVVAVVVAVAVAVAVAMVVVLVKTMVPAAVMLSQPYQSAHKAEPGATETTARRRADAATSTRPPDCDRDGPCTVHTAHCTTMHRSVCTLWAYCAVATSRLCTQRRDTLSHGPRRFRAGLAPLVFT